MKRPIQPLQYDDDGMLRFRANKIVRYLLDAGPFDMNKLAMMPGESEVYAGAFSQEDWEQFAQLIGYSLGGFGELSYVRDKTYERAAKKAEKVSKP